jgi:heat shock protein HspQ
MLVSSFYWGGIRIEQ